MVKSSYHTNLALIELVAEALGDLITEVVFLGGSVSGLLVDEPARGEVRQTEDVDIIVDIATKAAYYQFSDLLRGQGFRED